MKQNQEIRIALLIGGTSPEREISKSSSLSIYKALISLGYSTKLIDPAYGIKQPKTQEDFFSEKDYSELSNRNYVEAINSGLFDDVDLAFLGLHGKWGEDGTVQSLLELRGIKYTGSNVLSSAMAMDKEISKILFEKNNVSTPEWLVINGDESKTDYLKRIEECTGLPCVIKPNDQGSTVGLTICSNKGQINSAVELALKFSEKALVEKYIAGREMTVAVLNDLALPVLEIKPKSGFYDFASKYTAGLTEYEVPAKIPEDVFKMLQEDALKAYKALNCSVYARIDFRMDDDNKFYCLEVNTLPGMTATSLVPKMAKAVGITFEELIDKIVKTSL